MDTDNTQPQDQNAQTEPPVEATAPETTTPPAEPAAKPVDEVEKMKEVAKRAMADLENYKRRAESEKAAMGQFAFMNVTLAILPVLDSLQRALATIPEDIKENEWVKGMNVIEKQFTDIVIKQGLVNIPTVGQKFDPIKHQALMQGPGEKDMVTEEFEKGYMYGDKVLRPAKVKVGDGSAAA